jgi:hypothetical protein
VQAAEPVGHHAIAAAAHRECREYQKREDDNDDRERSLSHVNPRANDIECKLNRA